MPVPTRLNYGLGKAEDSSGEQSPKQCRYYSNQGDIATFQPYLLRSRMVALRSWHATLFVYFLVYQVCLPPTTMPRQSQRVIKRTIPFDERQTSPPPRPTKKAKKKQPEVPETKPANIAEATEVADLSKKLNDLYIPPIVVPETPITILVPERDSFSLFMRLLG
jgi:hypothetical protein